MEHLKLTPLAALTTIAAHSDFGTPETAGDLRRLFGESRRQTEQVLSWLEPDCVIRWRRTFGSPKFTVTDSGRERIKPILGNMLHLTRVFEVSEDDLLAWVNVATHMKTPDDRATQFDTVSDLHEACGHSLPNPRVKMAYWLFPQWSKPGKFTMTDDEFYIPLEQYLDHMGPLRFRRVGRGFIRHALGLDPNAFSDIGSLWPHQRRALLTHLDAVTSPLGDA